MFNLSTIFNKTQSTMLVLFFPILRIGRQSTMGLRNILFAYFVFIIVPLITASFYENERNLHTSLMTGYNKNIRPRSKDFEKTNIGFGIYLISLTKLDTVDGILTTTALMSVYWTDNNLRWNPSEHGYITAIPIQRDMIWSPRFTLLNTATKAESLGVSVSQTYLYWIGRVLWQFGHVMQSICDIDVTYFPFDIQRCVVEFFPLGLRHQYINITVQPMNLSFYSENPMWSLKSTISETAYFGFHPYPKYTLVLERRYTFYVLNLFSPVLIMTFLNTMVFILPANSGERVGYSITCLLSLSVYMTFASESLPSVSQPLPLITFVLLLYIVISALICAGTILGLKFHLNINSHIPPRFLVKMFFRYTAYKRVATDAANDETASCVIGDDKNKIMWKHIANRFDTMCFILSNMCNALLTSLYLVIVSTNK